MISAFMISTKKAPEEYHHDGNGEDIQSFDGDLHEIRLPEAECERILPR